MYSKSLKKRGVKFRVVLLIIFGVILILNSINIIAAPPNYTQSWVNTSLLATGYLINFSSNWSDDTALDSYIFSINQSTAFVNSTVKGFPGAGTSNTASNVTKITAPYGTNVTWMFWVNDSNNNWNSTPVQSFIVTCDYNGTGNWNINTTCIVSQRAFQINGNISIFSNGNLSLNNVNLTINNTDYLKFITVNSNGIFESLDLDNNNNTMQDRTKVIGLIVTSFSCTGTIGIDCTTIVSDPTCNGYSTNVCTYSELDGFCSNVYSSCSQISSQTACTQNLCSWNSYTTPSNSLGASRNSKVIIKNSFLENFGLGSGGAFGKNGFDLNGTSAIINSTISNTNLIVIYNNDTIFDGNNINGSLSYMTLITTENITIRNNNFNVTSSGGPAILIDGSNNINITHNAFLSNASGFVGIKTQDSNKITLFDNVINSVGSSLNQPEMYLLRTNLSNVSYVSLLGRSTNLLIWDSYNNSIEYLNASSTIVDSVFLINSSFNNFNRININTSTSGNGINLVQSHNNSVKDSIIEHKMNGLVFDVSSDNKLNNIYVMSYTAGTNSTKFMTNSANNIISNSILNSTGKDLATISGYNYFRNVSFNQSSNYASGAGYVNVQWYLDVNVSYYNGSAAQNTNVTLFNRSGVYYFSDLAGSDGMVARKNATEYIYNGTGKIFYTNYTITANMTAPGILNYSSNALNITTNIQWNISLQMIPDNNAPTWIVGSIEKNSSSINNNQLVNFTTNWTDNIILDSYILELNITGTWFNSTSVAFPQSAGANVSSNISRITASQGFNVSWRFWVNDSSGNWNVTFIQSFVVQDNTPPQYIVGSIEKNSSSINNNQLVNFTTNWTDNINLDSWIFEINQTGTFINSTSISFNMGSNISSNITYITANTGFNVSWRFWVNDSSGNWNVTQTQNFVMSQVSTQQQNSGSSSVGSSSLYIIIPNNTTNNTQNISPQNRNILQFNIDDEYITKIIFSSSQNLTNITFNPVSTELKFNLKNNSDILNVIKLYNLSYQNSDSIKIEFKIMKDYLESDNINKYQIALYSNINGIWIETDLDIINEDTEYIYYKSGILDSKNIAIVAKKPYLTYSIKKINLVAIIIAFFTAIIMIIFLISKFYINKNR